MGLITVNRNEITIGKPAPWNLYDQEHNVLVEQGNIISNKEHLDWLMDKGIFRELDWESADGKNDNSTSAEKTTKNQESGVVTQFTFDDMKLKVESRLQFEPTAHLSREHYFVKVIGYLRGASLLVTMPFTPKGERPELKEGQKANLRSFSGQNAFGFSCTIKRIAKSPYEYLHLSFPDNIQGIMIRKAIRIKARIIAAVTNHNQKNKEEIISALISNISADGAALDSKRSLGKKDDIINLAFRVNLHNIDAYLTVKAVIRAILSDDSTDSAFGSDIFRYGIRFMNLQPNDIVILQSMIYQQIIENPHNLI